MKKYSCDNCEKKFLLKISLVLHYRYQCGCGSACPIEDDIDLYAPTTGYGSYTDIEDLPPKNNPTMFKRKMKSLFT